MFESCEFDLKQLHLEQKALHILNECTQFVFSFCDQQCIIGLLRYQYFFQEIQGKQGRAVLLLTILLTEFCRRNGQLIVRNREGFVYLLLFFGNVAYIHNSINIVQLKSSKIYIANDILNGKKSYLQQKEKSESPTK